MTGQSKIQEAVDKNYEAFKKLFPELPKEKIGKYALMRDQEIVEIFDSVRDAMIYAESQYPDDLYSIQEITDKTVELGYFSHAMHINPI